jgi:hypothetical protein
LEFHEGGGLPGPEPAQGRREFSNPLRRLAEILGAEAAHHPGQRIVCVVVQGILDLVIRTQESRALRVGEAEPAEERRQPVGGR